MTLHEFVDGVRSGAIAVRQGGVEGGAAVTRVGPAELDVERLAAEAFAQGVLDDETSWEDAVHQVTEILS